MPGPFVRLGNEVCSSCYAALGKLVAGYNRGRNLNQADLGCRGIAIASSLAVSARDLPRNDGVPSQ
jgi:hypothetical protein